MPFFPEADPLPPVERAVDFDKYLQAYRASVPNTRKFIYCNHASVGPLSDWVVDAANESFRQQQMAESINQDPWFDSWRQTRQRTGELINAGRDEICLHPNTYLGMLRSFAALPLAQGDEVLVPNDEFPSLYFALSELGSAGITVRDVTSARGDGIVRTSDLLDAITPATKLIATSWVNFFHGYVHDLDALGSACKERGIWFVVDVIQGLGQLTLDAKRCQAQFISGHGAKWMCAPMGSGFLYVSRDVPPEITPRQHGWFSMELNHEHYTDRAISPKTNANRFGTGTVPMACAFGMRRASEIFMEAGPELCQQRAIAHGDAIEHAAREAGVGVYSDRSERRCAIVGLDLPTCPRLPAALREAGVVFSVREEKLRLSPHWYQTEDEIGHVCELISKHAGK
jgi:cysteine desulfurase / selenocysteine lyase